MWRSIRRHGNKVNGYENLTLEFFSVDHGSEEMLTILTGGRLVPGLVIFSLLGYGGQSAFNMVDAWQMGRDPTPSKPLMQRMADSKWIPLRHLSDEEYRGMLN